LTVLSRYALTCVLFTCSSPLPSSIAPFFSPFIFSPIRPPPSSTLFPYTTLFRSPVRTRPRTRARRPPGPLAPGCDDHRSRERERSEEHTSELQSRFDLVCRLLLEKKNEVDNRRATIVGVVTREMV